MRIEHHRNIDTQKIKARFSEDRKHRFSLYVPFFNKQKSNTLCIFGQNPSVADENYADQTLRYLEKFVDQNMPDYSAILMLNLYTRVDTNKVCHDSLISPEYHDFLDEVVMNHHDFLLVFGKLKNDGAYRFRDKALELKTLLKNKRTSKIALPRVAYAPHPGNPKIFYNKLDLMTEVYDFSDL